MKILLILLLILMTGCSTINPLINDDRFEDYTPWWATNEIKVVKVITNAEMRLEMINYDVSR